MESSQHNWANISETICPELLIFGVLDVVLSEYLNKSHNFTNFIFMTSSLRYSIHSVGESYQTLHSRIMTYMIAMY